MLYSRRRFLATIAMLSGVVQTQTVVGRDRIVQEEMRLAANRDYDWSCEGIRKVYMHNHGPGTVRIKIVMLAGYGDDERTVAERVVSKGSRADIRQRDGTGRDYRVTVRADEKAKVYLHIETH